jgi:lactate permease
MGPLLVFVFYALFAGALGYAIVWSRSVGIVNLGTAVASGIILLAVAILVVGHRRGVAGLDKQP